MPIYSAQVQSFQAEILTMSCLCSFIAAFHEVLPICHSLTLVAAQKENIQPRSPSLWGMQHRLNPLWQLLFPLHQVEPLCGLHSFHRRLRWDFRASIGPFKSSGAPSAARDCVVSLPSTTVPLGKGVCNSQISEFCNPSFVPEHRTCVWAQPHIQLELLVHFQYDGPRSLSETLGLFGVPGGIEVFPWQTPFGFPSQAPQMHGILRREKIKNPMFVNTCFDRQDQP